MKNAIIVAVLLVLTIAAPYVLRPKENAEIVSGKEAERLVIISPHNESIRAEFAIGFARHMQEAHGREVYIDWRQPGGTSEIAMFIKSEYENAFENHWKQKIGQPFSTVVRTAFSNGKLELPADSIGYNFDSIGYNALSRDEREIFARQMFLDSDVGIGIDLFFGGGAYDFIKQASAGAVVAEDVSGQYGPAALARQRPDWFSNAVMPDLVSGEPFRDSEYRWVGTVLSAFGICYNTDVVARLGVEPLDEWSDLADPRLAGQIALVDPTKSGSATKAYEMLIQQTIQEQLQSMQMQARSADLIEADAIKYGWDEAMRLILKISGNGRYFTNDATKTPTDVASGESAAGMCIDFYGRTYNEVKKKADGSSRIVFIMPKAGTSISPDPIAMLRGAPNPELAHKFIEFTLSEAGQKLWNFRPGTPGGPLRTALRRPPIRKDFYTAENLQYMTDADVNPYELSEGFTYRFAWTGAAFSSLRFIIRCTCVDTHIEQRRAWHALIEAGMPAEALAEYEDVSRISYANVMGGIRKTLKSKDKIQEVALARELSGHFREKYRRVIELCEEAGE